MAPLIKIFVWPAVVWDLLNDFLGDRLQVQFPLLLALLARVVIRVRLQSYPPLGKKWKCLLESESNPILKQKSEPHLGHKLYATVWLGFDGMSVCDCRSLLCSVHYRIVAEHVTQRSGGQVCKFAYNWSALKVKIRRTRAGTRLQNCLIEVVSLSPLQHRRLCHSSQSMRLASLFQHL